MGISHLTSVRFFLFLDRKTSHFHLDMKGSLGLRQSVLRSGAQFPLKAAKFLIFIPNFRPVVCVIKTKNKTER